MYTGTYDKKGLVFTKIFKSTFFQFFPLDFFISGHFRFTGTYILRYNWSRNWTLKKVLIFFRAAVSLVQDMKSTLSGSHLFCRPTISADGRFG